MDLKTSKQNPANDTVIDVQVKLCTPSIVRRTVGKPPPTTWSLVKFGKNSSDCPWQGNPRSEIFSGSTAITQPSHKFSDLSGLEIIVDKSTHKISILDKSKNLELYSDHERGFFKSKSGFEHWFNRGDEFVFGLGEKSGGLNKKFKRFRMRNTDALGYNAEHSDPLYKHWPFFVLKHPQSQFAVGIFLDHTCDLTFDFGSEIDNYYGPYNHIVSQSDYYDQYFIVGQSVADVCAQFSQAIGGQSFLPKWMLGNLASTMQYTEAENPEAEIIKFLEKQKTEGFKYSGFHFSSGYSLFGKKRFIFEWNKQKIADPKKLIDNLHEYGIKSAVNIKPCILEGHPKYDELKKQKLFIGQADTSKEPLKVKFWDSDGAFLDFTNPLAVAWWKRQVKESLLNNHVACVWNDNNEFNTRESQDDSMPQHHKIEGFGHTLNFEDYRPLQTLLMVKASTEAQEEHTPKLRASQITRSGMPGIQRYSSTWTGDNYSSWHSLKYSIPVGLGLSLSGFGNFGHDIGGFAGPSPEPELLLRWVQCGIFQPRFCIHSWNSDNVATEPWMYEATKTNIKSAIELRYELMPYFYNLMSRQHKFNEFINRPLALDFPNDTNCYERDFEFMCGPNLLVAPIYVKNCKQREVYLPAGTKWYSLLQKKWIDGGQTILEYVSLNEIPVFVKDGTLLPKSKNTQGNTCDHIDVYLSDAKQSAVLELYQDDGESVEYLTGAFCIQKIQATRNNGKIEISESVTGDQKFKSQYKTQII